MMKKILLVDDYATIRLMFSQTLAQQDANYEILEASNGQEACEIALEAKPDLILMDVMMPVMDGYEALASLKKDPETQAIPVLMLTSLDLPLHQKLAYEWGACGYLVKPVRFDEMHHRVKLALASHPAPQPTPVLCHPLAFAVRPLAQNTSSHKEAVP